MNEIATPFFGAWVFVSSQSHYDDSPPEQMTVVIEATADGLAYRSESRFAGGRVSSSHFVARLDNTPALVIGTFGYLAPVSLTPSSDGGIDAVYRSGLKKLASSHWAVNADNGALSITTDFLSASGEPHRNVVVFRRANPIGS